VIAARVGEMQAELFRLNALGERLVQMSGLSPEEFDFEDPPPRGGAEDGPARDFTIREIASELGSMVSLVQDRSASSRSSKTSSWTKGPYRSGDALRLAGPLRLHHLEIRFSGPSHQEEAPLSRGCRLRKSTRYPIVAVADGVVTFSGRKGGYGRTVDIRHVNGLVTRYAHNQDNLVKEGQMVRQGQKIATVGSSGTATGPHVHFEVLKDGKAVDPFRYIDRQPRPVVAGTSD
jgi:murein DD-endopeptidase MepM/ murein hydrolase activator NlpD